MAGQPRVDMYGKFAAVYDKLYGDSGKNYKGEADKLRGWIEEHKSSSGNDLLDVACGTGGHLPYLGKHYNVSGLDASEEMLTIAREKCPEVAFVKGDMQDFKLTKQFNIVTYLFSAIAYVITPEALARMIVNFASHLRDGGVVIVEPFFTPEELKDWTVHADFVDEPELKISRMNVSEVDGRVAIMDFHFQVGTPDGIEYFVEKHDTGLFTEDEYRAAFSAAGLSVLKDEEGLLGRGIYSGRKAH